MGGNVLSQSTRMWARSLTCRRISTGSVITSHGQRFLAITPLTRRFWIEKTIVAGREDRLTGDNALGRALWSPQRSKDGRNI
jgi:hypothetical protein